MERFIMIYLYEEESFHVLCNIIEHVPPYGSEPCQQGICRKKDRKNNIDIWIYKPLLTYVLFMK